MSSTAAPFGLKPAWHPSGTIRQLQSTISSAYGTDIFQYSPVRIDLTTGALTEADPGERAIGVFLGVEWTATDGRRRVGNRWEAGTIGKDIVAYYSEDPYITYEIQANTTLALAEVGSQYDWTALAGNVTTGLSSIALDVASGAAAAGLRVIGLNPAPDNIFGDAFPIVQVQISEHQYVADQAFA